jgi:hypothetical protein
LLRRLAAGRAKRGAGGYRAAAGKIRTAAPLAASLCELEEGQLHAEADQDDRRKCDNGMEAHDGPPTFCGPDNPAGRSNETN